VQRKLTVIVSADVVGYSSLMERDEAGTLTRLKTHRRDIFDPRIAAHGGRIVKLMGDGALVEFASVVSAVTCMNEIQQATEADRSAPDGDRIRYRVGITLGEVAVEFEDLGDHTVHNMERPIHVFALRGAGAMDSPAPASQDRSRVAICVLPFANMSGDPEQEYFSDGISEDIITDLCKVSSLWVAARNTAFTFKGKQVDAKDTARKLGVTHLLEGSVRKAGGRVRITAQLIEGATGGHVWAERYDRDLNDIFALQDEISQAIVAALKLRLLPEEKKAIEQRGTADPEAYKLYLMARQYSITGNLGSARRNEAIIRLCHRATDLDPRYARPWALMAAAQMSLRFHLGREGEDGMPAAERAVALDPNLAEAHSAMGRAFMQKRRYDEALREIEIALRLDPESYDANSAAGRWNYLNRRFDDAISYYEKAARLSDTEYMSAGLLVSCYKAVGDDAGARRAAKRALARTEAIVAQEPDNGSAMSYAVGALAALGEAERAKEWAQRALLLDPDNLNLRYNFACTLVIDLKDYDAALDLLEPVFAQLKVEAITWAKTDPDLDPIREHPRYKAMVAAAEARLGLP